MFASCGTRRREHDLRLVLRDRDCCSGARVRVVASWRSSCRDAIGIPRQMQGGVLDPAPSVYVREGRGQHRDRGLDTANRSVAELSGRIANTSERPRKAMGFDGRAHEVH